MLWKLWNIVLVWSCPCPGSYSLHFCFRLFEYTCECVCVCVKRLLCTVPVQSVCYFIRYAHLAQGRGTEGTRDWLNYHPNGGIQDSTVPSPFSPASNLSSPSATRFNFTNIGTHKIYTHLEKFYYNTNINKYLLKMYIPPNIFILLHRALVQNLIKGAVCYFCYSQFPARWTKV